MGDFGDRMKLYEGFEAGRKFIPLLPVCARLDGRSFSKFTKGMNRPYDERMSKLMEMTTKFLVEETNACIAYTQSDEISLVWYSGDIKSQIFFDGRIQKMTSTLSAICSVFFNKHLVDFFPDKTNQMPTFDCRVWNLPTLVEVANALLWREQDATKNSISMAARSVFSHNSLQGKKCQDMQEMLFKQGINWNDYPTFFKRGLFIQRHKVMRKFVPDELEKLIPKNIVRSHPDLEIERSEIKAIDMPPFGKVTNRVDVVFNGAKPLVDENIINS